MPPTNLLLELDNIEAVVLIDPRDEQSRVLLTTFLLRNSNFLLKRVHLVVAVQ